MHDFFKSQKLNAENVVTVNMCKHKINKDFPLILLISGHKKWVADRSLSECADDSVVQGVIESQLNRSSSGLETQNRISPLMVVYRSYSGKDNKYETLL